MKKFEESDIFVNKIKAHPKVKFFTYSGSVYYDNRFQTSETLKDYLSVLPAANVILTESGILLITENGYYLVAE